MGEKAKRHYVGLWISEDKNGKKYLQGTDKESGIAYFIFTDKDNEATKHLKITKNKGDFYTVGTFTTRSNDSGEFHTLNDYIYSANQFYEEGTNKPEYNISMPLPT